MGLPISIVSKAPNPFYPDGDGFDENTTIVFTLGKKSWVWIRVFSFNGQLVRTLVFGQFMAAGMYEVVWDGLDQTGSRLPADVYRIQILVQVGSRYHIASTQVMLMSRFTEPVGNPVYSPSDQQAQYPCVLFDEDRFGVPAGPPYLMWYDSSEPPVLTPRINLASSFDGINWTDEGTVSGLINPARCFVLYNPNWAGIKFKMWYWDTTINDSIEAIRYAESSDGNLWINDQGVTQNSVLRLVSGEPGTWNTFTFGPRFVVYTPGAPDAGIFPENHTYAMYYNVSPNLEKQVTGLAYSSDGLEWRVAQNLPVLTGTNFGGEELLDRQYTWDEYSVVLNSIAKTRSGMWIALYSAGDDITGIYKGLGFAFSPNGLNWVKGSFSNPLMHINDGAAWRESTTFTPFLVAEKNKFSGFGEAVRVKIWFSGSEEVVGLHPEEKFGIGYAVLTAEVI